MTHQVFAFVANSSLIDSTDYQSDARKVDLPVGHAIGGAQLAAMIRDLAAATTPAVVAEFTQSAGAVQVGMQ